FFFSSRRRHTRWPRDWSSDVCSSDLVEFREVQYVGDEAACRSERRDVVLGAGWDELRADGIRRREAAEKIDVALGRLASRELRRSEERRVGKECRSRGAAYD